LERHRECEQKYSGEKRRIYKKMGKSGIHSLRKDDCEKSGEESLVGFEGERFQEIVVMVKGG